MAVCSRCGKTKIEKKTRSGQDYLACPDPSCVRDDKKKGEKLPAKISDSAPAPKGPKPAHWLDDYL